MAEGQSGRIRGIRSNPVVMSGSFPGPQCQLYARLQVKECNSSVLEFLANDSISLQAEPIAIELNGPFEVFYGERDYCETRFHVSKLP